MDRRKHFAVVLHDGLSSHTAAGVLSKLNDNYSRILGDLSVPSIPMVTIEIWNDETHFQNDMKRDLGISYRGATGYIHGATTLRILNRGNLPQTALHEFVHIVSLHINKQIANNPLWLREATAIYEAGEFVHPRNISYLVGGDFPTLSELKTDYNQGNQKIYSFFTYLAVRLALLSRPPLVIAVTFTHLPTRAVLRIFTLPGTLVRFLDKNDTGSIWTWDLKNDYGAMIASGMYIILVDMPEVGMAKTRKPGILTWIWYISPDGVLEESSPQSKGFT